MKNTLYILKYAKRAEVMSKSEKFKPVALAVIELCLSKGISQLISQLFNQLLENSIKTRIFKIP